MKKRTNGKHVYPPKNSLVEYSKDHLWTWETVVALTIQFPGELFCGFLDAFEDDLATLLPNLRSTRNGISFLRAVNVDLEEWGPAE